MKYIASILLKFQPGVPSEIELNNTVIRTITLREDKPFADVNYACFSQLNEIVNYKKRYKLYLET